ncbi:MAG: hypothetical protein UT24_C0022G0023 [Candidatus Woesebacteria bacterium GW2011_GWB1_39_12]|uniref:Uncharacterized protein n=1 Tax=Candidatus Woesebacteria bacterium GW2011_GWB1_39_12 TaxID=1618574 RepID=A0A0G0M9H8_9BACT|nr:MAG: hypothetical protein UT24_C0022G0023 [Candidatus Woesebacteria bacterium GW2011_GWB1_39_12]
MKTLEENARDLWVYLSKYEGRKCDDWPMDGALFHLTDVEVFQRWAKFNIQASFENENLDYWEITIFQDEKQCYINIFCKDFHDLEKNETHIFDEGKMLIEKHFLRQHILLTIEELRVDDAARIHRQKDMNEQRKHSAMVIETQIFPELQKWATKHHHMSILSTGIADKRIRPKEKDSETILEKIHLFCRQDKYCPEAIHIDFKQNRTMCDDWGITIDAKNLNNEHFELFQCVMYLTGIRFIASSKNLQKILDWMDSKISIFLTDAPENSGTIE